MPRKVLIVSNLYPPFIVGGAEVVTMRLSQGLIKNGVSVEVLTLRMPVRVQEESVPDAKYYVKNIPVKRIPIRNIYNPFVGIVGACRKAIWHFFDSWNPFMGREFESVLEEFRPDVVHTHNLAGLSPYIWWSVKKRNLPVVHTIHDYYLICPKSTMYRDGNNCLKQCLDCGLYGVPRRLASRLVDVAVGVSEHILTRHIKEGYFPSARHRVIYNGYNGYSVPSLSKTRRKREVACPVRLGYIGRLHPTKGVETLIRAFAQLSCRPVELFIAGRGEEQYKRQIQRLSEGFRNVRWLGFVSPVEFFELVDVLVLPSLWNDPAPLVVIEALAHGVPVVGAERGGIPELVGPAGWTFNPEDVQGLTNLLRAIVEHPAEIREKAERALVRANFFTVERMVNDYLTVYSQVLEGISKGG